MEKISVIVPAYNTAPWLVRCLNSLLAQSHENMEVVVVNDGSKDNTREILDAYAAAHANVKVIHKENGGVTSARLRGVAEATGDWIGFVDGDDIIEPDMYDHLLQNAHETGADIAHCGHRVIFPDGRVELVHGTGEKKEQDHFMALRDLLDGGVIESGLCTKLFKRDLFAGLEEKMDLRIKNNEDLLMNYFLFEQAEKAVFEDICPYHYILRQGSASYRQLHEHSIFDPIRVRQIILEHCQEEMKVDARIALLRNLLFAYAQLALRMEKEFDGFRSRVRKLLKEQREYFSLLSMRNKVLANLVCTAPWAFTFAYGMYVKLFQKEEQH